MHRRLALIAMLIVTALPALAVQGFHKWYDEDGQAVYSQFVPEPGQASELVPPPPPPAEPPEVAKQRLMEQLQRSADYQEDQELAAKKAAEQQARASRNAERFAQALANLENLNGRARQLYRLPDGSVVRMSEAERNEKRAEMQRIIDESCP